MMVNNCTKWNMKQIIAVRIVANLGYVCHGQLWHSLDSLLASLRQNWPGCSLNVQDADADTAAYWRTSYKEGKAHYGDKLAA